MARADWARLPLLAAAWSASFLFAEIALEAYGPLTIAAGRVGLGALLLLLWIHVLGAGGFIPVHLWPACLAMGLLNNALPFSLIFWAQTRIDSGLAAILNATTPLFAAVLAAACGSERLTAPRLAALLLGIAGVALLVGPEAIGGLRHAVAAQGAVLLAALSYAAAGLFARVRLADLTPDMAAAGMLLASSVLLAPAALILEQPWRVEPDISALAAILALGLFGAALAYGLYFRILAKAGATNLLLVTFLLPIGALGLGVLLLGERVSLSQLGGLALILLALVLIDGRLARRLTATWRPAGAT